MEKGEEILNNNLKEIENNPIIFQNTKQAKYLREALIKLGKE